MPVRSEMLESGRVAVVEGAFDASAAQEVREVLASKSQEERLVVDFSRVRQFEDSAIALLAQDIDATRGRVVLRGLCQHQQRILRYFGVSVNS